MKETDEPEEYFFNDFSSYSATAFLISAEVAPSALELDATTQLSELSGAYIITHSALFAFSIVNERELYAIPTLPVRTEIFSVIVTF